MKIVAPSNLKIRFILFLSLFIIFGGIIGGTAVINLFSAVDVSVSNPKYKTVIIDAGHGGPDGGTSAEDGTLEKNINLQIAVKLDEFLKSMGIETVMIRSEDISVHDDYAKTIREKKISDIKNRLSVIENTDSAVFVSIHQNHFSQSKYSGLQVFYSKNNQESRSLADFVRQSVITSLQPENSREIKESGSDIYLLYHATVPAVMVECGFLSNYEEAQKLKDEEYQRKLAFLIALGITDFIKNTEAS